MISHWMRTHWISSRSSCLDNHDQHLILVLYVLMVIFRRNKSVSLKLKFRVNHVNFLRVFFEFSKKSSSHILRNNSDERSVEWSLINRKNKLIDEHIKDIRKVGKLEIPEKQWEKSMICQTRFESKTEKFDNSRRKLY